MPSKFTIWYALFVLAIVASLFIAYKPRITAPANDTGPVLRESARP